jgi:hypothetical protein
MIKQLVTATALAASLGLGSASGPARADAPEEFTANVAHERERPRRAQPDTTWTLGRGVATKTGVRGRPIHGGRRGTVALIDRVARLTVDVPDARSDCCGEFVERCRQP